MGISQIHNIYHILTKYWFISQQNAVNIIRKVFLICCVCVSFGNTYLWHSTPWPKFMTIFFANLFIFIFLVNRISHLTVLGNSLLFIKYRPSMNSRSQIWRSCREGNYHSMSLLPPNRVSPQSPISQNENFSIYFVISLSWPWRFVIGLSWPSIAPAWIVYLGI